MAGVIAQSEAVMGCVTMTGSVRGWSCYNGICEGILRKPIGSRCARKSDCLEDAFCVDNVCMANSLPRI